MSASLPDLIKTYSLYVLPHHALTRVIYWLTRRETSLATPVIRWFSAKFNVDMNDAQNPDLASYPSFNAFFTRSLKDAARPITEDISSIASPADGRVSAIGPITNAEGEARVFQAKGLNYNLTNLLGGDEQASKKLSRGSFATIYLSPRDYHRLHMPLAGKLIKQTHVPGRLFSVGPHTVRALPNLFTRNERVIAQFETEHGLMALVLVGAMNVAAIETVWDGLVTPPQKNSITHKDYQSEDDQQPTVYLEKGAEMGRFNMGSTIIVVLEKQANWLADLQPGEPVRMGQGIAQIN